MKHIYVKLHLYILIIIIFSVSVSAQNSEGLWTKISKESVSKSEQVIRKTEPTKAAFYRLDINGLKNILKNAPNRKGFIEVSNVIVSFPNPDGSFESFRVLEAPVMVPSLQAKHPNIRSYIGQSIENSATIIRFSITPQGLHTMTLTSNKGTQLIDPYSLNDNSYISYAKNDLPLSKDKFLCGVSDDISSGRENPIGNFTVQNASDGKMREFRLALACTAEYGNFHGGTEVSIKAAMGITMTRVNGIYERELSLTMLMIENSSIIYFGDVNADPYTNDDGLEMLDENQTEIDDDPAIGNAVYDIGHVFSTGGGGVASLNSPCNSGVKARGVTGLPSPVGDVFDIEYVCHEMGHQFGAPHTWNGDAGNCVSNQRTASNAYEPGSGSTIMGYAGICTPQNVQENTDDYFHQKSLEMIWANITTGASQCANAGATTTGNTAPTAAVVGSSYTIPISTPYKLVGSSSDVETTSTHTFTWEQWDLGAAGVPTQSTNPGPLVRSFKGTDNPIRYIPRLDSVLKNGGVSTTWEKLASVSRDINFKLTVRDNDSRGGQTDTADMLVTTAATAGPFLVTSQNTDQLVYASSENIEVTWDVASTDVGTVNTNFVNILLSEDGGLTYPHTLASGTANDGMQNVTLPNIEMPFCRIMVEGAGNIFFAVNAKDFAVGNYTYVAMDVCDDYLFNANIAVPENAGSYSAYVLNVPDSETISDMDINVNITHNDNLDLLYAYRAPFESSPTIHQLASGICSGAVDVDLTFDDEGSAVNCGSTNNGDNVIPQTALSAMDGQDSAGDWIFFITDVTVGDGDIATWNTTTLTICHSEFVPTLSTNDFNFEDSFSIYPNPNNGEFTVKLNSNSGNNINMSVYDIRGRLVFNNFYNNTSNFNEVINLGSVQSSLYILKITDGNKSGTKKIIIK